jgi:two-component system chemotaxis response regulator CheY
MGLNILVVDDSMTARMFIAKALELSAVETGNIIHAENGKQALDVLHKEWIDIVFADINMPEMNGVEMVKRMNEDGLMKTIPVVVVSTERSETRIEELKAAGVRVYLKKPFTPENLKRVVETVLNPNASPRHIEELGQ